MTVDLVVAPEVEFDVAEAYVWYESRRVGLGEEFLKFSGRVYGRIAPVARDASPSTPSSIARATPTNGASACPKWPRHARYHTG
ncbi:MAG TPA: hypothetical protein VGF59_27060, partial [Bryobacteraceae bacterium]